MTEVLSTLDSFGARWLLVCISALANSLTWSLEAHGDLAAVPSEHKCRLCDFCLFVKDCLLLPFCFHSTQNAEEQRYLPGQP